ncbi:Elongator protein 3/MiaB/NifB [Syntrophomonas zehnderi OL-4]|uniref:Elongator protein 3/MiaB/NifB n=1 Tax=Syntrophomonas zehnderi OL-4 TaxID=690567 RepID=A0A0E4GFB2_9FIRM|nr:radical SAM protein [Syntrophomonas zehnderi]CFY05406.1 Elongator protein 3/MiaB/NifB [Syntrophomonas zehnderi OL-4]
MKHYNIPIFIPHLGCPYDCIYCDQKKIAAQAQIPTDDAIISTIKQYLSTIPPTAEVELAFFGGSFTAIPIPEQEAFLKLIQPYLESGRIQGIRISTRPDCIDADGLDLLKGYGVKTIELGVQSLDDEVLQLSSRRYKAQDVRVSSALIQEKGFKLGIQLMIGLPGDTYERDIKTVKETIEMAPQMVRIYPTLVIAGTQLDKMWQEGKYQALSLEEAIAVCKDMRLLFSAASIPIIRMGLYPDEELRGSGVIKAGPFHPAFGELVEQAIFRDQAESALRQHINRYGSAERLYININERDLSKLLGRKRSNLNYLKELFALKELQVRMHPAQERNWIDISREETN